MSEASAGVTCADVNVVNALRSSPRQRLSRGGGHRKPLAREQRGSAPASGTGLGHVPEAEVDESHHETNS